MLSASKVPVRLLALSLLVVLAAGCGDADKPAASSDSPPPQTSAAKAALAYARCMREQGVDYPDPTIDADGQPQIDAPVGGDDKFQAATATCQRQVGGQPAVGGPSGGPSDGPSGGPPVPDQQMLDAAVKFARCMRQHGIDDFPDPVMTDGKLLLGPKDPARAQEPRFAAAGEKCRHLLAPLTGG